MPTPVNVFGMLSIVLAVATSSALAYTQEEVVQRTVPAAGVSMLSVSTVNGAISVQFLSLDSQGCELRTTNGKVTSALPLSPQGKISQRAMEGKINGGGPPLKLLTKNGGITIEGTRARE